MLQRDLCGSPQPVVFVQHGPAGVTKASVELPLIALGPKRRDGVAVVIAKRREPPSHSVPAIAGGIRKRKYVARAGRGTDTPATCRPPRSVLGMSLSVLGVLRSGPDVAGPGAVVSGVPRSGPGVSRSDPGAVRLGAAVTPPAGRAPG
jgi:hypothetical protein